MFLKALSDTIMEKSDVSLEMKLVDVSIFDCTSLLMTTVDEEVRVKTFGEALEFHKYEDKDKDKEKRIRGFKSIEIASDGGISFHKKKR